MTRDRIICVSVRYQKMRIMYVSKLTRKTLEVEVRANSQAAKNAIDLLNQGPIQVLVGQYGVSIAPRTVQPELPIFSIFHKGRKRSQSFIY